MAHYELFGKCMIQIQWTCKNIAEARKIAKTLVEKKWVGCVNILPTVESIYLWEGNTHQDFEVKVLFKTKEEYFQRIRDYIIANGSYIVPEISKIIIDETNPSYEKWLSSTLE